MDEDEDLSNVVSNNLRDRGVEILNNFELTTASVEKGKVICEVRDVISGHPQTITVDHCLYSIGRIPNTSKLDLHLAGVELDNRGGILTTKNAVSTVPHIYASGKYLLFLNVSL